MKDHDPGSREWLDQVKEEIIDLITRHHSILDNANSFW